MRGIIVQYTRNDGTIQKAIMHPEEQTPAFKNFERAMLRLVDDSINPLRNTTGGGIIAVKSIKELQQIGYVD